MSRDPLCPSVTACDCRHEDCCFCDSDAWCICRLIAKVRADERDSAIDRILETATYGPEFDRPVDDRTTAWMIQDDVIGAIERGSQP